MYTGANDDEKALTGLGKPVKKNLEWKPARGSDPFATCFNRRAFLKGGASLFGGLAIGASLQSLAPKAFASSGSAPSPYGVPLPAPDETTGLNLIRLPLGFRYKSFGWTGDLMQDNILTPAMHDGMGVTDVQGHKLVIVRNHEVGGGVPAFGPNPYSPDAGGGNTNLVFDLKTEQFESAKTSLSGTVRNCAGDPRRGSAVRQTDSFQVGERSLSPSS